MSVLSEVLQELSEWRLGGRKGKEIPQQIRVKVAKLLQEQPAWQLQKKLGINTKTLKNWKGQYSPEQFFIKLPEGHEEKKEIISSENLSLKISRGEWSLEGNLCLKDWQSTIRLLEGVRL